MRLRELPILGNSSSPAPHTFPPVRNGKREEGGEDQAILKDTSAQQFQISTKMLTEVIEPKGANNLYGEKIKIKST